MRPSRNARTKIILGSISLVMLLNRQNKEKNDGNRYLEIQFFSICYAVSKRTFRLIFFDASNFSIYAHVHDACDVHEYTEIRIAFARTRNKECHVSRTRIETNRLAEIRILDLLTVIWKPSHLSRYKPWDGSRILNYIPCLVRSRCAGEIKPNEITRDGALGPFALILR